MLKFTSALSEKSKSLLQNNVYSVRLKLIGTGYSVCYIQATKSLEFQFGYSHIISVKIPDQSDLQARVSGKKQRLVQLTSKSVIALLRFSTFLRTLHHRDPYHGKGLIFVRESKNLKIGKKKFT